MDEKEGYQDEKGGNASGHRLRAGVRKQRACRSPACERPPETGRRTQPTKASVGRHARRARSRHASRKRGGDPRWASRPCATASCVARRAAAWSPAEQPRRAAPAGGAPAPVERRRGGRGAAVRRRGRCGEFRATTAELPRHPCVARTASRGARAPSCARAAPRVRLCRPVRAARPAWAQRAAR